MKPYLNKIAMLILFSSLLLMDSCKKGDVASINPESSYAFLKNLNNERITEFDPELLSRIKKDLLNKNNTDLAKKLSNTYDFKTGKLNPIALKFAKSYNGARMASLTWHADWKKNNSTSTNITYPDAIGAVNIGASGYWLTALQLDTYPTYYPSNWGASDSFCYNGYIQNQGWIGPTGVNNYIETGSSSKKFEAYWVHVGYEIACYSWYRSLLSDNSTTEWVPNGSTCGTIGSGKSIVKIELRIVNIEGCD